MRDFDYSKLKDMKFSSEVVNLLSSIHEAKGRQEFYLSQKPKELNRLVEVSKVQSIEASNAIEGIRTTDIRLKQLVREKATPRNINEEEIAGYRDVLNTIHESFDHTPLDTNCILQLHQIMFSHVQGDNFGGRFKNSQNYIQGIDKAGNACIIFIPLSPYYTRDAIESLCNEYNKAIEEGEVDPLILMPVFIHDFLSIHPFRDGNGRMSRLLATLLLYKSGYFIGKYISLEAKIAKIKDLYYDALSESQVGWHEGEDDPTPFIKYMLSIIDMAYRDLENRVELVTTKMSANEMVRLAFDRKIGKVTKSDIAELCPSISISAVEKGIANLIKEGKIEKIGSSKSTYYIKK